MSKQRLSASTFALHAISPIDGRYAKTTEPLEEYFSEYGLIFYRFRFMIEYLIAITNHLGRNLNEDQKDKLEKLVQNFSDKDARSIKMIEKKINHDVKSVEVYLRRLLKNLSFPSEIIELLHFGLTSQDVDNICRTWQLYDMHEQVLRPKMMAIENKLFMEFIAVYKNMPMMARTHGQPASPTTFKKELQVFQERLNNQFAKFEDDFVFTVKLGGATGNFNAHKVAYPDIDWGEFAEIFVQNLFPCKRSKCTTQIDPYDSHSEFFGIYQRINTILIDFCQDIWRYISDECLLQKPKKGHVGSSTMPHKVNPIDFENGEGNLGFANAHFFYYMQKLPISRLQRDLTDSTVVRNWGTTFGHCLIAYNSILRGLDKILPNPVKMAEVLDNHWEVVTEAVQTILRREGYDGAYNKLKTFSRDTKNPVTKERLHAFINKLKDISPQVRTELLAISPYNYVGTAS